MSEPAPDRSIAGAVALVTGASGGLGRRIAAALAAEGAHVAVGYNTGADRAEDVRAMVEGAGCRAITVPIDLTDPASITEAVETVARDLGGPDILINNAGTATGGHDLPPGDLAAVTPAIWDQMMAVNLRGPFLLARAAAPHLRASPWGRIVGIGSTLGFGDWYADRAFSPSKAAMVPLTRYLAKSLAPDVTVNCVAPGLMLDTGLGGGAPAELIERWRTRSPIGAVTSTADVAAQVVTLCRSPTHDRPDRRGGWRHAFPLTRTRHYGSSVVRLPHHARSAKPPVKPRPPDRHGTRARYAPGSTIPWPTHCTAPLPPTSCPRASEPCRPQGSGPAPP